MEVLEQKKKPKRWAARFAIGLIVLLIIVGMFAIPYAIHYFYPDILEISDYEEDGGDVLIYWGNIIGGLIAVIGPIVLGLVTLKQNDRLMEQNERLVSLEVYNAAPVIKTSLFGLYRVKDALPETGSIHPEDVETLYSVKKDLSFADIPRTQSFILLDDSRQERDLMIVQIQNLGNYPVTKIKAFMDVENIKGDETEKKSIRLMNFAPNEKQYWSILVPRGDLDYLNVYIKIIEFEFFTYRDISRRMTLFYTSSEGTYGRVYNVELLLNDSYSDSEMEGVID